MVREVAIRCKFEAGPSHATTGKLSLSIKQQMGNFVE